MSNEITTNQDSSPDEELEDENQDAIDDLEKQDRLELRGEFFRINEKPNDDDYDFWKETQDE